MRNVKFIAYLDGKLTAEFIEPTPLYEDGVRVDGKQAVNDKGVPLWTLSCLYRCEGEKPEVVNVKVPSKGTPKIEVGQIVDAPLVAVPYISNGFIRYSFSLER